MIWMSRMSKDELDKYYYGEDEMGLTVVNCDNRYCNCQVMDYDEDEKVYRCPSCGQEVEDDPFLVVYMQHYLHVLESRERGEDDTEDIYEDDSDSRPGPTCSACGNPAYPDCMSGCQLIED